jgi:hypothetical protein
MGLTLIELIVSISILAIIGGVVATAFSVGLTILRPGGPQSRLFASDSVMVMEQVLGRDGARASCIQVPPSGTRYGSCSAAHFSLVNCPAADLCFGWPQVSDQSCHVADYRVGNAVIATRTEYVAGNLVPSSSSTLTREAAVTIAVGAPTTITPAGETYAWVRALPVAVTATGVVNPPSQALTLHPVATDPAGASSQITLTGSPC